MIRCVIIDNDDFAIKSLSEVIKEIKKIYSIDIVTTYNNSVDALKELKDNTNIDIIFIDYEMPGYNGIEFVKSLNNKNVSFVFVTSHSELSERIINEVNIIGFLSKPVISANLEIILKKYATLKTSVPNSKVIIPNGKKEDFYLDPKTIFYIKSEGKYKTFYGENIKNKPLAQNIDININNLLKIISPYGFEQISRKEIVNINKIHKRTNLEITLTNGEILYITESNKVSFFDNIKRIFKSN